MFVDTQVRFLGLISSWKIGFFNYSNYMSHDSRLVLERFFSGIGKRFASIEFLSPLL